MKKLTIKPALMQVGEPVPHFRITYILPLLFLFPSLFTACSNSEVNGERDESIECVSGVIVGQKCGDYALKVDKKGLLGAKEWDKRVFVDGKDEYITYDNVIGLLELPEAYRREGLKIFAKLRNPTKEESIVPCYTDMPNPPDPVYIVLVADSTSCPKEVYN